MKFEDNIQELKELLMSLPSLRIVNSTCRVNPGSTKKLSGGEFSIDFVVEENSAGWDTLEFISRALAVYETGSDYFHIDLSVKNYKGTTIVFVLEWHDYTGHDGSLYAEEIAKLSKSLRTVLDGAVSTESPRTFPLVN